MRQLRRHPPDGSLPRRLGAAVTLLAYAVTALGIPLPVPAAKDTSVSYPCQDLPCGCLSAEQCWTNCCCTTAAQRWAWARAHGVTPPDYAQRPADEGETPSCGESCCHDGDAHDGCRSCEEAGKPASGPAPFRLGSNAFKCQGLRTVWVIAGAALPAPPPAALETCMDSSPALLPPSTRPHKVATPPLDPPPRPSCA